MIRTQPGQVPQRTKRQIREARGRYGRTSSSVNWLDDRFGIARAGRALADKVFPDHWSFMIGEIALYSFVVLLATGIFLSLYYVPSTSMAVYHGSYRPLDGQWVSEAYSSTLNISLNVRAGLLMRQMHHWSADIFIGSMVLHMGRVFFTGAFRNPRETNWYVGVSVLILAIFNGFIGYSLPDDLISGTGLRIGYSILESVPFLGSYLATLTFDGIFPGGASLFARMYVVHILVIPLLLLALVGVHLVLLVVNKHTQFRGKNRTRRNVVGSPLWPNFTAKTVGFLLMISGAIALLGALVEINPIWQFGSYDPSKVSYAVQPDWYMGWIDGALRIMPSWQWTGWGHTIPFEVLLPGVVFPGVVFTIALLWPVIESHITRDRVVHDLLDRPRDRPRRTAFGVAFFAALAVLFVASSTDVLANFLHLSLNAVLWSMRALVLVIPVVAGLVTWKMCLEMQDVPTVGSRKRALIVSRDVDGHYFSEVANPRTGDQSEELAPTHVPDFIVTGDLVESSGVKVVER
jgi:ubiquinol-cytochrome c reductase cytochrome b subunit